MRRTGFLYDERFLLHLTGPDHPEAPERLEVAYARIRDSGLLERLVPIPARRVDEAWVETVHTPEHIRKIREACACGLTELEHPDNQICEHTFEVAMLAVGGLLEAARMLMEGEIDNAFCAVRPPGHHAETNRAMGFCYFNNVAITARYLQRQWNVKRIAIVDFDVHHGNGTQQIFERDPDVFFYSIHEHPSFSFPGTGREFEVGKGEGLGTTMNNPVLPGQGDRKYREMMERHLFPEMELFSPDFLLVSAGFDGHEDDDMSGMSLTNQGFAWIGKQLLDLADRYCEGRMICVLEGGYCLERLPELIQQQIEIQLGV